MRSSMLVLLFLLAAFPTVLVQVFLTPPIQVADEDNHFLRALQIADGHIFGAKIGGDDAGGTLDPAAPIFAHSFDALKFQPDVKLDLEAYAAAAALQWGDEPAAPAAFPNTAIYPAFLYVPASAGLALGRALHFSVLDSFYLARLLTAIFSVSLSALALAVCGRGRALLFVILCFPMTLSLFASVSQDATAIALGALAAATWSSYAARNAAMPVIVRAGVALALGAVAAARIPLGPLYVLALMPTQRSPDRRFRLSRADIIAAVAGLVPLAVGLYGAGVAKVAFRAGSGVSPIGQLRWLAIHPTEAAKVAARTLEAFVFRHLHEVVGVLGWLDTNLPSGFYRWTGLCVLAAALLDAAAARQNIPGVWRFLPVAAVLVSMAGVFGAFYLAWTPVGAPIVDGVQGRYFIVPAMVLSVSLPGLIRVGVLSKLPSEMLELALCVAVTAVNLWVVPITLLHRYYG
ncbi:MAG: DUF2142 domain-containing protein [Janthinobacterium lividum]